MKNIIIFCVLLLFIGNTYGQPLIIKGKITCLNQNANSTKGAENVIVVPTFLPAKSAITVTRPAGYFEFNTGVPITTLQDKTVTIYVISRCTSCKEIARRVFISEDQDRQNRDDTKKYVTVKDWMLNADCEKAQLKPFAADSLLNAVVKQPAQDLDKVSAATALTGAPAALNFLTNLVAVVAAAPAGNFQLQKLLPGKIHYGNFLLASPLMQSANTGFNFSPSRDMSEAVFWNPSAIANSRKPNNISLLTNLKNNIKAGGYARLTDKISLGGGFIYTKQDEFRNSFFINTDNIANPAKEVDSLSMKLREFAAFISPVYKVNKQFSIALTIKSIWQNFNVPYKVFATDASDIVDTSIKKQHIDIDISATYKINSSFQLGINFMNLAGTKLYADAFVPGQAIKPMQTQRSAGLGLLYKWQRLNVGADALFTEDGFYDATFGANYVPFNNALISAGFAVKQLSYSLAFKIKYFRIAYINDNNWMVNEKRKGKSGILNGKIYGGFVFDLN
ncbi:MAG: hypothetical protein ABJB86_19980 [Bacteroidota bacterium]